MENTFYITDAPLTLGIMKEVLDNNCKLELSEESVQRIVRCREYLDDKLAQSDEPYYGINTGFGSLYKHKIGKEALTELQENLVRSHACGTGAELPQEIVRLMLLLKIQSLSYGHSGVQLSTVKRLIDFFNEEVYPIAYEFGSLGASGDLAPLAHLSLPLMGEGEVYHQGEKLSGAQLMEKMGWEPVRLQAKEGLALLNGTQMMAAYGVWSVWHGKRLLTLANMVAALSLDAFDGRLDPFQDRIQHVRKHKGQLRVGQHFQHLLEGSELQKRHKPHVQDPYSFRCIPQVHGASRDAIAYVDTVIAEEINSVTDNPLIYPEEDCIVSGGNFHGQPLAMVLDHLAIAVHELGSISERRTFQLISGSRGLPDFLVAEPGLNSGLMIPQYTAAAIVSANKQLCTPASIDSIVSSNGQEDHVSMGANAATKTYRVLQNVYRILAIELLTASQALYFRKEEKTSPVLESFLGNFREGVSFIEHDRILHHDMVKAETFLTDVVLDETYF
ncbi:MAG TPA: histidine ammonia-lyase [Cytophagales bacterium]|nr:histidine ammonia-lyase [Cytophagales bacterium]HAP62958.1 histidine ammonia-lyase [Cytophagales bacterium]